MDCVLIATRSEHKAREIEAILAELHEAGAGVMPRVLTLVEAGVAPSDAEDDLEPFDTFEENALSKARYFADLTGLATIADDSGLEVEALGMRPGVRTKRFAPLNDYPGLDQDEANNTHLLQELEGVPVESRGARYVCVAALVLPDGGFRTFRGEAPGEIGLTREGSGGFGYDPLFFDPDLGKTFAEISGEEKNQRSHRGAAMRALCRALQEGLR